MVPRLGRLSRFVTRITKRELGTDFRVIKGQSTLQDQKRLGILCWIVIAGVLVCTLWPFDPFPANQVSWLPDSNGIRFGSHGVVFSKGPLLTEPTAGRGACTLEILLRPASVDGGYTILSIYAPGNPKRFRVRQWTDGLLVSRADLEAGQKAKTQKFDVDHAFQAGTLLLITMTAGPNGTIVYLDGRRARVLPKFAFTKGDISGQVVLGTSAVDYHPWHGEIRGLAMYGRELTSDEALRNYQEWTTRGDAGADLGAAIAKFPFTERTGTEIRNAVRSGPDLEIPRSFDVPHKPMLQSPREEFERSWAYLQDLVQNIAGFVPVGFLLCAYLGMTRDRKSAILYATLTGGLLSVAIETVQAYIPSRGSGITDVITNTLGTALGAVLARTNLVRAGLQGADCALAGLRRQASVPRRISDV